jgi:exopolyphosphatase / guanosine-5'-triphosphate,3'-diphosphate pyrophosphatase
MENKRLIAVIDIGSTAIRLIISEIGADDSDWKVVDRAIKPVTLGKEVFFSGYIGREVLNHCLRILSGFREMLDAWHIGSDEVQVIATSAIREAKNRDTFVDRVYMNTGFDVKIVEGIEENQLTYLAVQHSVKRLRPQLVVGNSLIIEVGGGTTEIMLLRKGKMVAAHSLRLGTVRLESQREIIADSHLEVDNYLRENIRGLVDTLNNEMRLNKIRHFVAVGGDARIAAREVGETVLEHISIIEVEKFKSLISRIQDSSAEELVHNLQITYNEAESLHPALLIYKQFLDMTTAEQIIVPDVSIREGVLLNYTFQDSPLVEKQFYAQVIASAINLGKKYHFDEKHGVHVSKLALSFFDQFKAEHGLDRHARLILEVAAILHDIGNYIRTSGHHKHGHYLISNSEIFGFSLLDIQIISNIVRYHRKAVPLNSHTNFSSLQRNDRIMVQKLSAILRIADAMDRGHLQKIHNFVLENREEDVYIKCSYTGNLSVERYGLKNKGSLFENIFGYKVFLV